MFLIALALAQAAPFDIKADYGELAKQHCAKEWPADFTMQRHCLQQQVAGMQKVKAVYDDLGDAFNPTLEKCVEEWTKDRIPDWQMIGYCAGQQAEAYRQINP